MNKGIAILSKNGNGVKGSTSIYISGLPRLPSDKGGRPGFDSRLDFFPGRITPVSPFLCLPLFAANSWGFLWWRWGKQADGHIKRQIYKQTTEE